MPLIKTGSDAARSKNIAAEIRSGTPRDQAIAISYRIQRDAKRKHAAQGGRINGYAAGGSPPFYVRDQVRGLQRAGMINSATAGRMDKLPMGVKAGSYVIPAFAVSSIGQGNSMAGANGLNKLFRMGPYSSGMPSMPSPRRPGKFANGGAPDGQDGTVDIMASGGEFIVPSEKVQELGGGDLKRGHDVLDAFVAQLRKKTIKTLRKLPKPRKR